MAEPIPVDSVLGPARAGWWTRWLARFGPLALVLELALAARVVAANLVEWYVRRGGTDRLCVFPDTRIYWELARKIRIGAPYEIVEWADIPHFALRTPGYPLVMAGCQALFGERPLAVRLVQAVLGTASVYLVYRLTREFTDCAQPIKTGRWSPALIAAGLAAVHPYYAFLSAILLSEAVFVPLMLGALWGQAILWARPGHAITGVGWKASSVALASGIAAGVAVLARPSWALYVPVMLAMPMIASLRARRGVFAPARTAVIAAIGVAIVMAPWWARNASIYGRFVPTALWMGASLYDGLNPGATGASDMTFLSDPEIWPLDEEDQDAELSRRAAAFVRDRPGRALALAMVKLGRYWTPWPNADVLRSPVVAIAGGLVELPILGLMLVGAWDRRIDLRAWVLLAGPILYFCVLHLVFASSMRYRIPGELPALGLAAIGWTKLALWRDRARVSG